MRATEFSFGVVVFSVVEDELLVVSDELEGISSVVEPGLVSCD
jgi:hypothetical protein